MADKAISELVAAEQITATDMFVLEQNNTAKKLSGQVLLNWLTAAANGHGSISSIEKYSSDGLVDTYRITLADTTTFDFEVTNGKGITSIQQGGTQGLRTAYKINYNDGTATSFTVTNGEKGDKGDAAYTWIKYASQEPTEDSHSMSDIPDSWIGVYSGNSSTAPTDYTQYKWFLMKGDKGEPGDPAILESFKVEYQVSTSGTVIPSGSWSTSVPVVAQGKYLWTRTTTTFNSGSPVVAYSVSRMGLDGSGSVASVSGISPDSEGNVPLTAKDINALPTTGGTMTGRLAADGGQIVLRNGAQIVVVDGKINMQNHQLINVPDPSEDKDAANKSYVDTEVAALAQAIQNILQCTTADNGKFLRVVDGEAKWQTVQSAEEVSV